MTDTIEQFSQLTPKVIVRFPNLSGAIVEVAALNEDRRIGGMRLLVGARCTGCLEAYSRGEYIPNIDHPRAWSAKHAATCRALPQPETAEKDGEDK